MIPARFTLAMLFAASLVPGSSLGVTETEQRAAVLVYRQALHPDGDSLALTARLLAEHAGDAGELENEALERLRERLRETTGATNGAPGLPVSLPRGAGDLAASMVSRHAGALRTPRAPRLWPTWALVNSGEGLDDLVPYLRTAVRDAAGASWRDVLAAAGRDPELAGAIDPLVRELTGAPLDAALQEWIGTDPAMPPADLDIGPGARWRSAALVALESALADPGQVSPELTARLRARWYLVSRAPDAGAAELAVTGLWIGLRGNVPALAEGNPVPFIGTMIAGARELAQLPSPLNQALRDDMAAGVTLLSGLPGDEAGRWHAIDSRLSDIHAAVLDELQRAASEDQLPGRRALLMLEARLDLMDDDWEAYLMQPFREPIQQALATCFSGGEVSAPSCLARFENWALEGALIPEASGGLAGPFAAEYLLRETELNPWQRVNYLRGFWRNLLARECSGQSRVRNALEWALASRAYLEVVRRQSDPLDEDWIKGLDRLADAGASLARDLDAFGACRAQGLGPLGRTLGAYGAAVDGLADALPEAREAFGDRVLEAGADISLDEGLGQATDYVPGDLAIGPCDAGSACGVTLQLPATRALYEHFPTPFRVADQAGMGSLSLCYGDVSWVERRAEPVKAASGVMANYHGRLNFRVRGRYAVGGEERDVFVMRLISRREHPYLFAPDRPEVLADPCPEEFRGRQTMGELPASRGWLVPRRLTFLSGERTPPARLFSENWLRGEEWLARLGRGEQVAFERRTGGEELTERLASHLATLRDRRRAWIYEQLLAPTPAEVTEDNVDRLAATALRLAAMRRTADAGARVLVPRSATLLPALRGSLYGDNALVGSGVIRAWRDAGRDPMELPAAARQRLDEADGAWRRETDRAEIAPFVARTLIAILGTRASLSPDDSSAPGAEGGALPTQTAPGSVPFR